MIKLFTLKGANEMLSTVDARLQDLQDALAELREARSSLEKVAPLTTESMAANQELAFLIRNVHTARREVQKLGVQVPDLDAGIVEFPARLGGEIVHLVWQRGQGAITEYHRLTGDEARRPIESHDDTGAKRPLST